MIQSVDCIITVADYDDVDLVVVLLKPAVDYLLNDDPRHICEQKIEEEEHQDKKTRYFVSLLHNEQDREENCKHLDINKEHIVEFLQEPPLEDSAVNGLDEYYKQIGKEQDYIELSVVCDFINVIQKSEKISKQKRDLQCDHIGEDELYVFCS